MLFYLPLIYSPMPISPEEKHQVERMKANMGSLSGRLGVHYPPQHLPMVFNATVDDESSDDEMPAILSEDDASSYEPEPPNEDENL